MPGIYLANVLQSSRGGQTYFKPDIPSGTTYSVLMIDTVKLKSIIVSPVNTLSQTGVTLLRSAATWALLHADIVNNQPTANELTTLNNWLTNNSYVAVASGLNWKNTLEAAARQNNRAARLDLDLTI